MRYFVPQFKIATLAPAQDRLVSKIGGVPWGLPEALWPSCCGVPQKLLAQLRHEPPMLDLGAAGAVLHLFQCLKCGGLNESGRGALIVDQAVLGTGPVRIADYDSISEYGPALIGEAFITGWDERDDGIPESRLGDFFNEEKARAIEGEFPQVNWLDFRQWTRFGGSPRWTGWGAVGFPTPPHEYLFQINNDLYVDGPVPNPDEVGCPVGLFPVNKSEAYRQTAPSADRVRINAPWIVVQEQPNNYFLFEYTNLGTDGVVYVFINRSCRPHEVKWFWNR